MVRKPIKEAILLTQKQETLSITIMDRRCLIRKKLMREVKFQRHSAMKNIISIHIKLEVTLIMIGITSQLLRVKWDQDQHQERVQLVLELVQLEKAKLLRRQEALVEGMQLLVLQEVLVRDLGLE